MSLKKAKYPVIFLLLSIVFVVFFCIVSSPLIQGYTGDSSVFMALGKMFLDGKIPYVDFFDHKGPSIILVEAIGQIITPYRCGIFILEVVNLWLVLFFLYKTASLLLNPKKSLIVILLFLIFLSSTISQGNTTEEFSLLPLFIALFIGCKYFLDARRITNYSAFVLGVCFSFLFWLRLNNAGFLCGIVAFIFFNLLFNKEYKSLLNLVIYFLLGQLPFTTIYITYFAWHGALYDLIYATFLFNFNYIQSYLTPFNKYWSLNLLVLVVLFAGAYLFYRKRKDKSVFLLVICIYCASFLTINIGYVFKHYFILYCPALALGLILILEQLNKKIHINRILILSISALFVTVLVKGIRIGKERKKLEIANVVYKDNAENLLAQIPVEERTRVYYYNIKSQFYPMLGLNANYKYFILQEWHGSFDSNILSEISEYLVSSNGPLWVLIEKNGESTTINSNVLNSLNKKYTICLENEQFELYRLIR